MTKNFSERSVKEFNLARRIFQYIACNWFIIRGVKAKYNVKKPIGLENIDREKQYIITSNHITGFDPFFMRSQLNVPIAYMAKKELFEPFWSKILMDWCGAFAVDRDNVSISTIKTALSIKKTDWNLGLFPQGTRCNNGKLEHVTKGFATMSKKMGMDVLPVSIIIEDNNKNGKKDLYVKIGEAISCKESVDDIYNKWCNVISKDTGLEYISS